MLLRFARFLGPLRAALVLFTLICIVAGPFAVGVTQTSGWGMVPTLLMPSLAPVLFFVLPMDMVMSGVFMSDKPEPARRRYRIIIRLQAVLLVALTLSWLPFVLYLLNR